MANLRVLIADDSALYRRILASAVAAAAPSAEVETVKDGLEVLQRLREAHFDAILMDVNMPGKNGLETLSELRPLYPNLPVVIVSGASSKAADLTLEALERGALDFIAKPQGGKFEENMEAIIRPLSALFRQISIHAIRTNIRLGRTATPVTPPTRSSRPGTVPQPPATTRPSMTSQLPPLQPLPSTTETAPRRMVASEPRLDTVDLVVIASSTGGPAALDRVICPLPANFDKPILIVQHMPAGFTAALANKMNSRSAIRVIEAADGVPIRGGLAQIAPGGSHLIITRGKLLRLDQGEHVNGVRPAADVLFRSIAKEFKGLKILSVVLTGMGSDGTAGVSELKKNCRCYSIAQSEETCVVYGMPKSIVDAQLSDEVCDLNNIAKRIVEIVRHGAGGV
ncbi:MAG: chemotaxis-specific protein-glutamate methyltransferase CheB [Symbiobacteriaceae bacterium]|nr:chemotaxis-specific protein-glutamate methyltransferase CheB [Symbiobacteriaceae bacterium]